MVVVIIRALWLCLLAMKLIFTTREDVTKITEMQQKTVEAFC